MSEAYYKRKQKAIQIVYELHDEGEDFPTIFERVFIETGLGKNAVRKIIQVKETLKELKKEKEKGE